VLKSEAMELLGELGWLATTPAHFRAAMLLECDLLPLRRGETLFSAGDHSGGIFGVVKGRIELHLPAGFEGSTLAFACGAGHWFGEISALGGGERRVSIIAAKDTLILRLMRANMQRIAEQDPEAWMHFARLLARNLGIAMDVVTAIRFEHPLQRIAAMLQFLLRADESRGPKISVSQSDLGAMAGLSRNSVNRALAELERLGIIHRSYGVVEIIDLAGLRGVLTADTA
jgi:CRP/FNR family cyclic AMP-dependent transcriptional regulator